MRVRSLAVRSWSSDACRLSWLAWFSRAEIFSCTQKHLCEPPALPGPSPEAGQEVGAAGCRCLAGAAHLPPGDAAVELAPLLEQLLTHGFSLLLQAALPLQLLELQVLEPFGSCFQRLPVLMEDTRVLRSEVGLTDGHEVHREAVTFRF